MMWRPLSILVPVLLVFALASCRKDGDTVPPKVQILLPMQGSLVSVPDTLLVRASVSDDRMVREVTIALLDNDGIPVVPTLSVTVNAREATVERPMPVSDERLRSGQYTLVVRASDGTNETNAFRSVAVNEAPLRLRGIFATGLPGAAPTSVYFVDSLFQPTLFTTLGQDLRNAGISSHHGMVFLAGGLTGHFTAVDAESGTTRWSITNQMPGQAPYFNSQGVSATGEHVYVGTEDGLLRGYRGSGGQVFTATSLPQFRFQATMEHDEVVLSAQKDIALPLRRLVSYWRNSGIQAASFELDMDVVAMFRAGSQHTLLFGNRDGQGVVQHKHLFEGGGWEPRVFSEGEIISVARLNSDVWVLALPGSLVRYRYSDNSAWTFAAPGEVRHLAYDPASGSLVAAVGSAIVLIDPGNGAVVQQVNLGEELGFVMPWNNR